MTVTPPVAPQVVPTPKKGGGCWKWGAIGCGIIILLGGIGCVVTVVLAFGALKSNDAYRDALATAQRDPRVIEMLGSPVEAGWWVTGNFNFNTQGGHADFEFPIHGPKDDGRVHAVATRDTTGWHNKELTMTPRHGPPIDLLSR